MPMDEQREQRVGWGMRISIKPSTKKAIKFLASLERVSMATVIGRALDDYVTARSSE